MKRLKVKFTNELLSKLLKVKDGIKLIDTQSNSFNNTTEVLFESDQFDDVVEGCETPATDINEVLDTVKPKFGQVIKTNLSYGEAMIALRNGDVVTRAVWFGYWRIEVIKGLSNPIIVATCKDGSRVPATPYQEDMAATDWMVVIPDEQLEINEYVPPVVTERDIKGLAYGAQQFILNRCDSIDGFFIHGLDQREITWVIYLVARNIIKIYPFAEAQMPSARLTEKGKSFLHKLREIEENR